MKKGIVTILTGVGIATSLTMVQAQAIKPLAAEMRPLVARAAQNPASIQDMEIPAEQLPAFVANTCKAIEKSLRFMSDQAVQESIVAVESLDKAVKNPQPVLEASFAKPMVQALPGISASLRNSLSQSSNRLDNAQHKALAQNVVSNVGAIATEDAVSEAEVAVRMALASAAFVNAASDEQDALADSLNALLPEAYRGPFESGETLVSLAAMETPGAYAEMTSITGVDILIEVLLPPPPPPVPFETPLSQQHTFVDNFPGKDLPYPPFLLPYNNQCGCQIVNP